MAKKTQDTGLKPILNDIEHGRFAPVYLLHGEEAYYIDLISDALEGKVVAEDERDFNCDIYYGNDTDVAYVVATAQQFPVMSQRRLVILKEAQGMQMAKNQLEKLSSYASRPNMSTVLVIAYKGDPFTPSSALVKAVKEGGGVVFRSDSPTEYYLEAHVRDYITLNRVNIDDKALKMMIDYIGAPLSKFFGELDKLVNIKGKGNRITSEDVEKNIGVSKEFNTYELVNAVAAKDYPMAMRIVKYFETNPKTSQKTNPLYMLTGSMFNYFSNLVAAFYLPDKSDASINQALGFKSPVQLRSLKLGMRNYTAAAAVNAIHYLREFDTRSKGIESTQTDVDLLDELIFKIFT